MQKTISIVAALSLLSLAGCQDDGDLPKLGTAQGTVRLDGKPLPNAVVAFYPTEARASFAQTNENGQYEMVYLREHKGAVAGKHRVKIELVDPDAAGVPAIPAKYNSQTTLEVEVKLGDNPPFDFDLKSK